MKKTRLHPAVEIARTHFVHGGILDTDKLASIAGVHPRTIRAHKRQWQEDLKQNIIANNPEINNRSVSVSPDDNLKHIDDCNFIRTRVDDTKKEIQKLDSTVKSLHSIIKNLSESTDSGEMAITLLDKYIRLSLNKKSLDKHFLDLKRAWDSKVGIDSMISINESAAKCENKEKIKNLGMENASPPVKTIEINGVFRKKLA